MLRTTFFNIRYATQNLMRGGLWTVFAIVCIAAGVAAVVALRSLGLAIGDTLLSTVRSQNNGDITLIRGEDNPLSGIFAVEGFAGNETFVFEENHVNDAVNYVSQKGGTFALYTEASGIQITVPDSVTAGRPQFVTVFFIDPQTFPPMGPIEAIAPADTLITELLTGEGNQIVVSENFADSHSIEIGSSVRVSGTEELFTVAGIVATSEEAGLSDWVSSFFGFAYMHENLKETLDVNPQPNRISMIFPDGTDILQSARELDHLMPRRTSVRNVVSIEDTLGTVSDVLGRAIVITGLGALVIGGVGIINTMLVMVRRRTMEIATLKTLGLRGGQIANLFIWEALLLGFLGSAVGIIIGIALGGIVNNFGETFLRQSLVWRVYPEAMVYGMVLGLSVTVVFGVLPVLTATRVRPAIVLRPNEFHFPVAGILQSIAALLLIVVSIGVMVGTILGGLITDRWWGDMLIGLGGTAAAMVIIGLLIVIMWAVVWLVSRLPAFGLVDLRLALRNMTSRRWRTATTLLALAAGMFALSSITFVSQSIREVVQFQLSNTLGGNVLVFPLTTVFASPDLFDPFINGRIDQLEGVEYRTRSDFYPVEALALDGEALEFETFTFEDDDGDEQEFSDGTFLMIAQRTDNPNPSFGEVTSGRGLTAEDVGKRIMVIHEEAIAEGDLNYEVGQVVTVRSQGRGTQSVDFEIVGITTGGAAGFGQAFVPLGAMESRPQGSITTVQVSDEYLDNALLALTSLPTVFVLDISFVDGLIQNLIDQFSALPIVIGLLSLLAAAAIMANTVLLATLERRKQIGVLKAIGLKSWRVLGVLLLENSIIALLGAGIGIGLSALNSTIISMTGSGNLIPIPANALPLTFQLILAAVVISWLATLASAGVVTRERVTTVLRYD